MPKGRYSGGSGSSQTRVTTNWLAAVVPKPLSVALRLRYKPVSGHFRYALFCKREEDIGPGKLVIYISEHAQKLRRSKF
jgi:hypothetical protein